MDRHYLSKWSTFLWTLVILALFLPKGMGEAGHRRQTYVVRYKNGENTIPVTVVLDYKKQAEYVINMNPRTPAKSVTFYDFKQKAIAYKDLTNRECFIGRLTHETLHEENAVLKDIKSPVERRPLVLNLDSDRAGLTPTEIRNMAGQKIAMFCRAMSTWLLTAQSPHKRNRRQTEQYVERTYGHYGHQNLEYSHYGHETYRISRRPGRHHLRQRSNKHQNSSRSRNLRHQLATTHPDQTDSKEEHSPSNSKSRNGERLRYASQERHSEEPHQIPGRHISQDNTFVPRRGNSFYNETFPSENHEPKLANLERNQFFNAAKLKTPGTRAAIYSNDHEDDDKVDNLDSDPLTEHLDFAHQITNHGYGTINPHQKPLHPTLLPIESPHRISTPRSFKPFSFNTQLGYEISSPSGLRAGYNTELGSSTNHSPEKTLNQFGGEWSGNPIPFSYKPSENPDDPNNTQSLNYRSKIPQTHSYSSTEDGGIRRVQNNNFVPYNLHKSNNLEIYSPENHRLKHLPAPYTLSNDKPETRRISPSVYSSEEDIGNRRNHRREFNHHVPVAHEDTRTQTHRSETLPYGSNYNVPIELKRTEANSNRFPYDSSLNQGNLKWPLPYNSPAQELHENNPKPSPYKHPVISENKLDFQNISNGYIHSIDTESKFNASQNERLINPTLDFNNFHKPSPFTYQSSANTFPLGKQHGLHEDNYFQFENDKLQNTGYRKTSNHDDVGTRFVSKEPRELEGETSYGIEHFVKTNGHDTNANSRSHVDTSRHNLENSSTIEFQERQLLPKTRFATDASNFPQNQFGTIDILPSNLNRNNATFPDYISIRDLEVISKLNDPHEHHASFFNGGTGERLTPIGHRDDVVHNQQGSNISSEADPTAVSEFPPTVETQRHSNVGHRSDIPSEEFINPKISNSSNVHQRQQKQGFVVPNVTVKEGFPTRQERVHNVLQLFTPDEIVIDIGKLPNEDPPHSVAGFHRKPHSGNSTVIRAARNRTKVHHIGRTGQSSGSTWRRTHDQPSKTFREHHAKDFRNFNQPTRKNSKDDTQGQHPGALLPPGVSVYPRHPQAPYAELASPSAKRTMMTSLQDRGPQRHPQRHHRKRNRPTSSCCRGQQGSACCQSRGPCCSVRQRRGQLLTTCCPHSNINSTRHRQASPSTVVQEVTANTQRNTVQDSRNRCEKEKMCRTLYQSTQPVLVCRNAEVAGC